MIVYLHYAVTAYHMIFLFKNAGKRYEETSAEAARLTGTKAAGPG
jgi:hypothetical protein